MSPAQTTSGWLDALANYLASISSLSLTKGTNLFAENFIDDPDILTDQVIIYDDGVEHMFNFRHLHLNWSIRFTTTRKKRIDAAAALTPIFDHFLDMKRFVASSDAGESFTIVTTRSVSAPDLTERTESGRFAASCVLQFELIPD